MAGYVFAIGGDTEIIKICAERGVYATRLNSLASRPFEATLADYVSMKPGDNVYFLVSVNLWYRRISCNRAGLQVLEFSGFLNLRSGRLRRCEG